MNEQLIHCDKKIKGCLEGINIMGEDEPDEMLVRNSSIVMNWKTNDGYFKIRPDNAPNQMIFNKEKQLRVASWFKTKFLSENENNVDFTTTTIENENESLKKMDLLHNEKGPAFISYVGKRPVYYYYLNGSSVNFKMSDFFQKNGINYVNGEKVPEENFAWFVMNYINKT